MTLAEHDRRKPNFDQANSVGVVLADAQTWYVPKPWLEICPVFEGGEAKRSYPFLAYTPRIDGLIELIEECRVPADQICAVATLAAYLLQQHYELDDGDLDQLLHFRVGDEESQAWVREVMAVATGHSGPKAVRGGGVSR